MKRTLLTAALGLAAPLGASASELSYSYFEAGYFHLNQDLGSNADGYGLRGSGALNDYLHIVVSYDRADENHVDQDDWRIGLGYNTAINQQVDFVGRLSYESFSADFQMIDPIGTFESKADGFSAEAGVRAAFGPHFEGGALLRHRNLDYDNVNVSENDTALVLNGQYKFNANWGISAEVSVGNDDSSVFVGPRFSY